MKTILIRSTIVFLLSGAGILYFDAQDYRAKKMASSIGAGILLVLFVLCFRVSSGYLGAVLLESIGLPRYWGIAPGLLLGLWSSAIFLQYAQNRIKIRFELRPEKIRLLRLNREKVRKSDVAR